MVLTAVGAGLYAAWNGDGAGGGAPSGTAATVRRGTFSVTVEEDGEIEADKRVTISNELQWPVIIDKVVEDGNIVEADEVIVKFSCKELEDAVRKQELTVRSARSDYETAQADLELKKIEVAEDIRRAEQTLQDARADKQRYLEGEWPVKKSEQEQDIELLKREMQIASENLTFKKEWHGKLADKSPYTDSEIESDELSLDRKKLSLVKAEAQLRMLLEYDHPKELRSLDNAVKDAEVALERAEHDAKLELRKAEERVANEEETRNRHEDELKRLQDQQAKLTVKTQQEGLVVYDTGRSRWNNNDVNVTEGEKINPRQQLMIIPDMTTLQVRTKVYEAVSRMVSKGVKATIRLESRPDLVLTGTVHKVSALPDRSNWWNPDVKVFPVIVKLDQDVEGLKPNMTARVELELAKIEDAVLAPVAAVFTEQDTSYCWKLDGAGRPRKAEVRVGLSNDREVQVLEGLEPGDRVLLIEPESGADQTANGMAESPMSPPGMGG